MKISSILSKKDKPPVLDVPAASKTPVQKKQALGDTLRIEHTASLAFLSLSKKILELFKASGKSELVIICIGTDRSTGDCLGPLVGTFLKEKGFQNVYGTLEDPVHAVNIPSMIETIATKHPDGFFVAVDACLGELKSIGTIFIHNTPLKPGAGVKKELPEVGDIHIAGIVNVGGFMEYFVLQNTRLSLVMKQAKVISMALSNALSSSLKKESEQIV